MKNIYLLGASGSIGIQTLDVIKQYEDKFKLIAVSVGRNITKLEEIIKDNNTIKYVCVSLEEDYSKLVRKYKDIKFFFGDEGLIEIAQIDEKGLVVNALVGAVGLKPTIAAMKCKKDICLANKETLVMAGDIIKTLAKENNVSLVPIDSEHSAIMQCIEDINKDKIEKIIITASGGSFRYKTRDELSQVTIKDALNHPNWSMGNKITIDSATMMNKGLEVIEAFHLFDLPIEKIETILHYESVVHSMVTYVDGTTMAHLGSADMRIPILHSLSHPKRLEHKNRAEFSLSKIGTLTFKEMDEERYPCVKFAYDAIKMGGIIPVVLNAANEVAVELFLSEKIGFLEIENIIKNEIYSYTNIIDPTIDDILNVDESVRVKIKSMY